MMRPLLSGPQHDRAVVWKPLMSKRPKSGLDPVKIYKHASAFHKSYDLLTKAVIPANGALSEEQLVGTIAHPAMVLSIFASELYLKCLLCVESGSVPEGHNLKKLFSGLQLATRRELDDLWDADIRHPDKQDAIERLRSMPLGQEIRLDLRYALDVGANSFTELRYFYETERAYVLISHFPFLLRNVILKRSPSWGAIVPDPSKGLIRSNKRTR